MTTDADDYAARIMKKYGWERGRGLGKEQQGMERPLSVPSQKTTEGIGYQASLFEPWWNDLYDKVASSITVSRRDREEGSSKGSGGTRSSRSKDLKDQKRHRSRRSKRSKEERSSLEKSTKRKKRSTDKNKDN